MSLIQLEKISKQYTNKAGVVREVLREISMTIEKGDSIAIVGPSGSGKSTLLNIIGGLDYPSTGVVYFNGKPTNTLNEKQLSGWRNQDLGFVFQMHHLLPQLNLMENTLLPTLPGSARKEDPGFMERARHLLEMVGLLDKQHQYPDELSGGECQRAAVVRALINQPLLLLADEPTGSLDQMAADEVGGLLSMINTQHQLALVVVTHSMKLAEKMETIFELIDGRLHKIE